MSDLGRPRKAQHKPSAFAGLLKPVSELPPEQEAETPQPRAETGSPSVEATTVDAAPPATKPKRRGKPAGTEASPTPAATEDGERDLVNQPVNVTLRESLMSKLNAYKEETGLSHPIILFTAIESHYDELADRLRHSASGGAAPEGAKSLFDMPRLVSHKTDGERTETFIIRVNKKNKAILDGLWKELGAPSRNALFVAAYEAFLSTK